MVLCVCIHHGLSEECGGLASFEGVRLDDSGPPQDKETIQSESVSTYLVYPQNTRCYLILLLLLSTNLLLYNLG